MHPGHQVPKVLKTIRLHAQICSSHQVHDSVIVRRRLECIITAASDYYFPMFASAWLRMLAHPSIC